VVLQVAPGIVPPPQVCMHSRCADEHGQLCCLFKLVLGGLVPLSPMVPRLPLGMERMTFHIP
jgi:hypothetical protein